MFVCEVWGVFDEGKVGVDVEVIGMVWIVVILFLGLFFFGRSEVVDGV